MLDWFHITMKFKAAQNAVNGCAVIEWFERAEREREIQGAKWLVWHGKGSKAVARINEIYELLLARPGYESSTFWWNFSRVGSNIRNNAGTLVNYGGLHRRGLPIISSIAQSAVNLVVSHRMAKKQQMRWTDEGAHSLVQLREAALNGELWTVRLSALAKKLAMYSRHARPVS